MNSIKTGTNVLEYCLLVGALAVAGVALYEPLVTKTAKLLQRTRLELCAATTPKEVCENTTFAKK